jgi:hypothetical protein
VAVGLLAAAVLSTSVTAAVVGAAIVAAAAVASAFVGEGAADSSGEVSRSGCFIADSNGEFGSAAASCPSSSSPMLGVRELSIDPLAPSSVPTAITALSPLGTCRTVGIECARACGGESTLVALLMRALDRVFWEVATPVVALSLRAALKCARLINSLDEFDW